MMKNRSEVDMIPDCLKFDGWVRVVDLYMAETLGPFGLLKIQDPDLLRKHHPNFVRDLLVTLYEHHPDRGCRL